MRIRLAVFYALSQAETDDLCSGIMSALKLRGAHVYVEPRTDVSSTQALVCSLEDVKPWVLADAMELGTLRDRVEKAVTKVVGPGTKIIMARVEPQLQAAA